jgi:hypothetical protein
MTTSVFENEAFIDRYSYDFSFFILIMGICVKTTKYSEKKKFEDTNGVIRNVNRRMTNNTMAKRRTDKTMAKRRRTDHTMAKRRRTDNTIAKRRRTDNTMTKRRRTDMTMAKKDKKANNDQQNIKLKIEQYEPY